MRKILNILYVDVNNEHCNPMHIRVKYALAERANVTFFGPGYSSREQMEKGVKDIIRLKAIDIIMVHGEFVDCCSELLGELPTAAYSVHRYSPNRFSLMEAIYYAPIILEQLLEINDIPCIYVMNKDFQTMTEHKESAIKQLLGKNFYVMGFGKDFLMGKQNIKFGIKKTNCRALNICNDFPDRIIPILPVGVDTNNFYFKNLEDRSYDWVVSGNVNQKYPQRLEVEKRLEQEHYRIWHEEKLCRDLPYKEKALVRFWMVEHNNFYDRVIDTLWNSRYIPSNISKELLAAYRENYLESLRKSKCSYVDGSDCKVIVNKYFEVPAAGTLMIGDRVTGLEELGFVDGTHYIYCEPDSIVQTYESLKKNPRMMQEIAENGQQLVMKKHTFRNRAMNITDVFETILKGRYRGAYWEKGELIFEV